MSIQRNYKNNVGIHAIIGEVCRHLANLS